MLICFCPKSTEANAAHNERRGFYFWDGFYFSNVTADSSDIVLHMILKWFHLSLCIIDLNRNDERDNGDLIRS